MVETWCIFSIRTWVEVINLSYKFILILLCTLTLSVLIGTKTSFPFFHLQNVSSISTPSHWWICQYTRKKLNLVAFLVGGSRSGWSPFFEVATIFMYLCFLVCASRTSGFSSPKKVRLISNLWRSLSAWF